MKQPRHDHLKTRIIPGLSASYQIVSLPYWAWYWLEDFMRQNRISYRGIYETFGAHGNINETLQQLAELHHDYAMREVYNLANDNELDDHDIITRLKTPKRKQKELTLPKIYKIFGFMSCATTLEAVWERKHYNDSHKVT